MSPQLTGLGPMVGLTGYTVNLWGPFLQRTCPSRLCISPSSAEEVTEPKTWDLMLEPKEGVLCGLQHRVLEKVLLEELIMYGGICRRRPAWRDAGRSGFCVGRDLPVCWDQAGPVNSGRGSSGEK